MKTIGGTSVKSITLLDLTKMFDEALRNYHGLTRHVDEDNQQYMARCYLEAAVTLLEQERPKYELRNYSGSVDED